MSASGKSSNRHSEYARGLHTGTGHGPYAAEGIRDRERRLFNRDASARCAACGRPTYALLRVDGDWTSCCPTTACRNRLPCTRPPRGWYCTRPAGHDGPCPTWPTRWTVAKTGLRHLVRRIRDPYRWRTGPDPVTPPRPRSLP